MYLDLTVSLTEMQGAEEHVIGKHRHEVAKSRLWDTPSPVFFISEIERGGEGKLLKTLKSQKTSHFNVGDLFKQPVKKIREDI